MVNGQRSIVNGQLSCILKLASSTQYPVSCLHSMLFALCSMQFSILYPASFSQVEYRKKEFMCQLKRHPDNHHLFFLRKNGAGKSKLLLEILGKEF
jgi:hypothetical protein